MSDQRTSTVVVSNEPVEAVTDKPIVVVPETPAVVELSAEEAESARVASETTGEVPPVAKPSKLQQRFSELTGKAKEAQDRAERAERELAEVKNKVTPVQTPVQNTGEPDPQNYTDIFKYTSDLAEYKANSIMSKRDAEVQARTQQEHQAQVQTSWRAKMAMAATEIQDFDDVVLGSNVTVSDQVRDAIMESDVGHKVLYELAKNPDIANRLNSMTLPQAMRELGKIEARLENVQPAKVTPPAVSKAPPPITRIGSGSTTSEIPMTDGNFTGSYAQWKELRKAGKIK